MIDCIISGGQTGVDLAALTTASALSIPTSGWAAQEWKTEDGPAPWLADFGLRECPRPGYPARTEANVQDSHGTLVITREIKLTGGTYDTVCLCESMDKPCYIIRLVNGRHTMDGWIGHGYISTTIHNSILSFPDWLAIHSIKRLNIAGPRESKCPGIFVAASELLMNLLNKVCIPFVESTK